PYPAEQVPPDWLRALPRQAQIPGHGMLPTLSADSGISAAASAGYIIPLTYRCEFERDERGTVTYKSVGAPIYTQAADQFRGTWFEKAVIIKFFNPWVVRTPPGYCALFTSPINRFQIPFEPLSGI